MQRGHSKIVHNYRGWFSSKSRQGYFLPAASCDRQVSDPSSLWFLDGREAKKGRWHIDHSGAVAVAQFYVILCNPMLRSEDIETRRGKVLLQTALKTRFWWAFIDCEGLLELYLISKMWIIGSAEPDVMYKPSGDQAWFIRADCDSLLSCFHPNAWISVCLNLESSNRSCLSGVLHAQTY